MIHCSGIIIENTSWVWVFYVSAILTLVWVRYIILSDQLNHHLTHFKHLPNNLSLKRIWREIYIFQIHDIKLPFNFIECIATICFEQDNSFIQIFVGLALVSLHVWPAWVRSLHIRSYIHHSCLTIAILLENGTIVKRLLYGAKSLKLCALSSSVHVGIRGTKRQGHILSSSEQLIKITSPLFRCGEKVHPEWEVVQPVPGVQINMIDGGKSN